MHSCHTVVDQKQSQVDIVNAFAFPIHIECVLCFRVVGYFSSADFACCCFGSCSLRRMRLKRNWCLFKQKNQLQTRPRQFQWNGQSVCCRSFSTLTARLRHQNAPFWFARACCLQQQGCQFVVTTRIATTPKSLISRNSTPATGQRALWLVFSCCGWHLDNLINLHGRVLVYHQVERARKVSFVLWLTSRSRTPTRGQESEVFQMGRWQLGLELAFNRSCSLQTDFRLAKCVGTGAGWHNTSVPIY